VKFYAVVLWVIVQCNHKAGYQYFTGIYRRNWRWKKLFSCKTMVSTCRITWWDNQDGHGKNKNMKGVW